MSICTESFDDLETALRRLENLASRSDTTIFRGLSESSYRLISTMQRDYKVAEEMRAVMIELLITDFRSGLARIGVHPFETESRLDWLEYARHYGVPSPCIDFTYSPYIALFFAFTGFRFDHRVMRDADHYSVVSVVNVDSLANHYTQCMGGRDSFTDRYLQFLGSPTKQFENEFPEGLLFIPTPGKYNLRMQRQLGAMLYDNFTSEKRFSDLEGFIDNIREPDVALPDRGPNNREPTLIKIQINKRLQRAVFEKLELMGINGSSLFLDERGVALDILNSYVYNPRCSAIRGTDFGTEAK